jgi:hypothetical protein
MARVLVISSVRSPVQRRLWEDAFTAELAGHSVAATSSYQLFPEALPDTDQVYRIVRSEKFDGVLVIRRLAPETTAEYVDGYVAEEVHMHYDRRREGFTTYYRNVAHPAYIDSQKVDIRAFDLWETKSDGQIVWSATSQTPEPNSLQIVRPEIVGLVVSTLAKTGIISSTR